MPGLIRRLSAPFRSKSSQDGVTGSSSSTNTKPAATSKPTTSGTSSGTAPAAKGQSTNTNKGGYANGASNGVSKRAPPSANATNGASNGHTSETISEEDKMDDTAVTRADVEATYAQFAQLIHSSNRPLPVQSGDGAYLEKEEPTGIWADIKKLGFKDVKTVEHMLTDKLSGDYMDDKLMHMEEIMQLVSALPTRSAKRVELTGLFLDELWNSLQHPPLSYLGDKYTYRSGDGSGNNFIFPKLGAANMPYAKSVAPRTVRPGALPDPELIFDAIYAREKFKPNPNKVSSIFFDWASLVIHDLFQTDHHDFNISKTSSYLDLSTLYGDVQEEQDQIRTFKDGKLKPDCFSESRLLAFPPACGVMLIMLNRWHNYVVENLAAINENGRFTKPSGRDRMGQPLSPEQLEAAWKKYDNDLFQTGRLITCGMYINITLYDYLRTIVNLNRSNTTWTLDPRMDKPKQFANDGTPRGVGNQVSAEFNLCYRWHSAISAEDEEWTNHIYREMFGGKEPNEVTQRDLMEGLGKWDKYMSPDPTKRDFAHLKRGPDGKYNDDDLVAIMKAGIESCAGAFGARNVPKALKQIEILGMQQARSWNLATLNEFRKFFKLKPYDTFEEINDDPEVAQSLKDLYEHPDYVEIYPGIVAENAKEPMIPGVGICPTMTVSRAVLSDAVALVRGDRFYTLDYNPKNLTNWGYREVDYDLNLNQGCVFYKLMLRAFPNHFKPDSIYAHYPMTIPSENAIIMEKLGRKQDYSWDVPTKIPERINLTSYDAAQYVLNRKTDFNVMWTEGFLYTMGKSGTDFMLGGDTQFHAKQRQIMAKSIYRDQWKQHIKQFYEYITLRLLHEKSIKIAGRNQVDITRDVGNLAHTHFAANMFALPLKTAENPKGIFSEQELYMAVAVIFTAIFFDFEPTKSFLLKNGAKKVSAILGKLIEANIKSVAMTGFMAKFLDGYRENDNSLSDYGVHMVRRLLETGMSPHEIAFSQILPTACAMVPNQAQVFTQIIDFYLDSKNKEHLLEIHRLSKINDEASDDALLHYCMEGIRLNGTFGSYRRSTVSTTIQDGDRSIPIHPGDKVFVSFVAPARDPAVFTNPDAVDITRPLDRYIHYGIGEHSCLGQAASQVALTAMLRVVGGLENLRRAPGPQGELKKIARPGGFYVYMREDQGSFFVFPCSLKVHYDGGLPEVRRQTRGMGRGDGH